MNRLGPGSKLGRFEISGLLGEGAMGSVFLAHDPRIERPVAIKTLRHEALGSERAAEIESRFLREAKLAGRLQHPNIVTIYEVGEDGGVFFIAMEYVDGQSLTRWISSRPDFSLTERVDVVRQVVLALEHAHGRGVLHRDIKPGNILLTKERRVKVADFGIGKLLAATGDLTRTGQMLGSPAYMSPEQIRGEKLDGRSDFFSLGVVFYELLTGSRPFPGDSITTLVYQILHTEPRDPLELRADLPGSTRGVFARLLAKSAQKRPADAGEFLREIRKIETELSDAEQTHALVVPMPSRGASAIPPGVENSKASTAAGAPPGAARPAPRPFRPTVLLAAAALLVALAALILLWRSTGQRAESVGSATEPLAAPTQVPAPATAVPAAEAPAPTSAALPTPGPPVAADAVVGAPRRVASPAAARALAPAAAPVPSARPAPPERIAGAAEQPPPAPAAFAPDKVYRTRRSARFGVSPDQGRIFVDGRFVGIADDWDSRGGGKELEFTEGRHRVRLELPGYRNVDLELVVTADAEDETVHIDDELERQTKTSFPKIPRLNVSTRGSVEFAVEPPDVTLSEGDVTLGPASSFGAASPLRLSGPMVHELLLSAPGHQSKTVRVLISANADDERAKVKETLKKE
ncbi:MAG: serine/threonine-protein kinase [Thermoanaerobaculia bacterium]